MTEFPKCRKAYEKGELPEPTRWRTQYLVSLFTTVSTHADTIFFPKLCGEERERELDHLGSKLKERYAEAQEQRSSRKMVITERAPVQAGRRTTGTTVAGSTGAQSKGSKILSRARGQALRLRGPRRAAPVRIVGDAHISFLDRWNPPAKNSFEGAAFTTSVAPPPKPASVRPVAPRPSTSDTAPPRLSARHATAAPLPADPAAAPPILDFFGASASKPSRSLSSSSSSKRSRTVTTVSVQKKRKVQATGPKGLVGASIYPLSSPPHSASSPASSAGSPTLVHPGGCAPSWNSEMSPASPSSATTLEDAGSGCSSRGLDFFGPSSQRCKPGVRSGNHAVLQKQAHPVVPAPDRASTKGSALDSSPTLPAGIRSQTVAAALYAQANGQTTSDDEFK